MLILDVLLRLGAVLGIIDIVAWQINVRIFFIPRAGRKFLFMAVWTLAVSGVGLWGLVQPGGWGRGWSMFWIFVFVTRAFYLRIRRRALRRPVPLGLKSSRVPVAGGATRGWNQAGDLEICRVELPHPDYPKDAPDIEFIYLSDIHVGPYAPDAYWDRLRRAVVSLSGPVVFGGDLITKSENLVQAEEFMKSLGPEKASWAVLGNHDHWTHPTEVARTVESAGFTVLRDQASPWAQGHGVGVYGSDDFSSRPRSLPSPAYPFTILFCHTPDRFFEAVAAGYPLVFCGHTHGGQIHVPVFRELLIPSVHDRLFTSGFYADKQTRMWIGRGVGGPPFLRHGARPEILHFKITKGQRERLGDKGTRRRGD